MKVEILASSSRANAVLLDDGGRRLLLDAGMRERDLRRALGHRLADLDGCLVSHEHADHAVGARGVIWAGVDVWASAGTIQALDLYSHRTYPLTALVPTDIGNGWTVVGLPAIHDAEEPFGFLVERGRSKVLYLTDTGYTPYRFQGLTTILIEANWHAEILLRSRANPAHVNRVLQNHMSLERAIELLRANDLSAVEGIWLLHLSDGHSDAEAFRRSVARATGRPTYVAEPWSLKGAP